MPLVNHEKRCLNSAAVLSGEKKIPVLGYLSGAPRVSRGSNAEATGPRTHVVSVIKAFEKLGWEVKPFIVGDMMPDRSLQGSENVLASNFLSRFTADLIRLAIGQTVPWLALLKLGQRVDWVYERFAVFQALGWVFRFNDILWILETNGLFFNEAKRDRKSIVCSEIARSLEIWAYKKCDVLICVSEILKKQIIHEAGVSPEKIVVVPNGVDPEFFNPSVQKSRRFFDGPTLGYVGSLIEWQGIETLLEVMDELSREGIIYSLALAGDGPMRNYLINTVNRMNLTRRVMIAGRIPLEEVPGFIGGFDIGFSGHHIMSTGDMYHSPLKLYEYMAMSKPAVASDFEDARNLIVHGQTGYLFNPGSKDSLKRVLRLAYSERRKWKKMGDSARETILKKHSWEKRVAYMIQEIRSRWS